jgi:DNA-binding beta-propeller fold protein YncE
VIGVHSAKFPTERDAAALPEAVARYGIAHPVLNDAEMEVWQAYGVRAWPTLVLVDPEGYVVGGVSGEGHAPVLRQHIARLLEHARAAERPAPPPKPFALTRTGGHAAARGRPRAALHFPGKLLAESHGNRLFVSDTGRHRVMVADQSGAILDVAGAADEPGLADGTFDAARFREPRGLALVGPHLYVVESGNHTVRRLHLGERTVETIAGTGRQHLGPPPRGRPPRETDLNSPWDALAHGGWLYLAMAGSHQIWRLALDAAARLEPFAGTGQEHLADGPRDRAGFNQPSGLAADGRVLYVADTEASAIRAVQLDEPGLVRTVVGEGLFDFGDEDGAGDAVRLQHVEAVAYAGGTLYLADTYNHKVKRLDPATRAVTTWLGTGRPGRETGARATLFEPQGLSVAGGRVFVADTNNHRIVSAPLATGVVEEVALR